MATHTHLDPGAFVCLKPDLDCELNRFSVESSVVYLVTGNLVRTRFLGL